MPEGIIKLSETVKKLIVAILTAAGTLVLAFAEALGWTLDWWALMPSFSILLGVVLGVEWVVPTRVQRQLNTGDGTDAG